MFETAYGIEPVGYYIIIALYVKLFEIAIARGLRVVLNHTFLTILLRIHVQSVCVSRYDLDEKVSKYYD